VGAIAVDAPRDIRLARKLIQAGQPITDDAWEPATIPH
jgi:hypothetical protein